MPESVTLPPWPKTRTAIPSPAGKLARGKNPADPAVASTLPVLVDEPDQSTEDLGAVAAALTSGTAVSFASSATFHLIAWGLALLICQLFGLDWTQLTESKESSIQAALGDEDVLDDMARFEIVGEFGPELEIPLNGLEQIGQQLRESDQALLSSATGEIFGNVSNGAVGEDGGGKEGGGTGVLLRVPASGLAVTKGSFTAFTIPAHPEPRQAYSIVIEIRLKDNVRQYRVSDLSGEVRGSDNYVQKLPFDSRAPMASGFPASDRKITPLTGATILDVVNNRVQIIVKVPGAARLVRDEIHIRSKKLREEQEITLIFGKPVEETPAPKTPEE